MAVVVISVDIHEHGVYFLLVVDNSQNQKAATSHCKFDRLQSHLFIDGILVFLDEKADLRHASLLHSCESEVYHLVDVDVVDVANKLFPSQFIGEEAEEKEEEGVGICG